MQGTVDCYKLTLQFPQGCNDPLWVLKFDHEARLILSRGLHPVERLSLQGFPPWVAAGLSKSQLLLCTGNAMSVPVVGAALHMILKTLANSEQFRLRVPRALVDSERIIRERN